MKLNNPKNQFWYAVCSNQFCDQFLQVKKFKKYTPTNSTLFEERNVLCECGFSPKINRERSAALKFVVAEIERRAISLHENQKNAL